MKIKRKIEHKIQVFILFTVVVIYAIAIGYISIKSKRMAHNDAIKISDKYIKGAAQEVRIYLEKYYSTVTELNNTFKIYNAIDRKNRRKVFGQILINSLEKNSDFLAVWSTWEPNALDSLDHLYKNKRGSTIIGNFGHLYYKNNGKIVLDEVIESDAASIFSGDYYQLPKKTRQTVILEPYYYSYTNNKENEVLETSIVAPIIIENNFMGVVGADIKLKQFQDIINNIKPFEKSKAFLISNEGIFITNSNPEFIGQTVNELFPEEDQEHNISKNIKDGKFLGYSDVGIDGKMQYIAYAPIEIGNTNTPWAIGIAVPIDLMMSKADQNFRISLFVGIIGIALLGLVIYFIAKSITNPILVITKYLKKLSKGHIGSDMYVDIKSGDEIEEMSEALNKSISGLINKTEFAKDIGNANFKKELELLSDEDVLGKSLLDMRNKLRDAQEEERIRKIEDDKREWANKGLALFGDVLRQNYENLNDLAFKIIIDLVNYLNANQGGLFIKNEDNKNHIFFEQLATYAFNRKKFIKKTIELGEGLIGTCAIEKETIYITEVPQNYIRITSGLGGSNPNSILIVPLKVEEEVLGIIEIASFNTFEKHEIEFTEKIGQNIASTLASARVSERTAQLLEKTQQQAEEMAAQEEEMRQNMEELQATQEESSRIAENSKQKIIELQNDKLKKQKPAK